MVIDEKWYEVNSEFEQAAVKPNIRFASTNSLGIFAGKIRSSAISHIPSTSIFLKREREIEIYIY